MRLWYHRAEARRCDLPQWRGGDWAGRDMTPSGYQRSSSEGGTINLYWKEYGGVGGQRSSFLLRCRIDQGPVLLSLMAGQVGVFVRAAASRWWTRRGYRPVNRSIVQNLRRLSMWRDQLEPFTLLARDYLAGWKICKRVNYICLSI